MNIGGGINIGPGISILNDYVAPVFVTTNALLYLDAGQTASYSGSGTTWTDLSTNTNNATIAGSPSFTSSGAASYFSFNGAGTQYASTPTSKYNTTYTGKTTFFAARMNARVLSLCLSNCACRAFSSVRSVLTVALGFLIIAPLSRSLCLLP